MKTFIILWFLLIHATFFCQTKIDALATVIKLQSAETLNNLIEAEKYIDLERTFGELAKVEKKSSYQLWEDFVNFQYELGKDKKFTNVFTYYDFNIEVEKTKKTYKVIFTYQFADNGLKSIIYKLEKIEGNLKVVDIIFIK